jgi:hypothetical protein
MDARKQFLAQINQVFTPVLTADGFTGSGNTYRRVIGEVFHVLTLQGLASGGKCCVCLGIHLGFLPGPSSLTPPDPKTIEESDCGFRTRLTPNGQSDAWWPYGTTEQEARGSAESIRDLYQQLGAPFFQRFSTFPEDFTRVTPAMLTAGGELPFPPGKSFCGNALVLAQIAKRVGRIEDARQFAEVGLERTPDVKKPLKHAFRKILETV